jgi:hypothetical protein
VTDDPPTNGAIDTTVPNVARVWDYQLRGNDNFAVERAAADAINEACQPVGAPGGRDVARENRDFIRRVVGYLAVTHVTSDARPDLAAKVADEFARLHITTPLIPRTRQQIGAFFDGFDLVDPGLVFPTQWDPQRPRENLGSQWMSVGVGRKPTPARDVR